MQEGVGHLLPGYVKRLALVHLWDRNDGLSQGKVSVVGTSAQMEKGDKEL